MVFPKIPYLVIYHILYLAILYVGKCHNVLLPFGRLLLFRASTNIVKSLPPLYQLLDEGDMYGTNVINNS